MATDVQAGAPAGNESVTGLVTGIIHDAQELFKQQIALLKHEVREDVRRTAVASLALAAGALVLALGALLLVVMLPLLLSYLVPTLPLWASFGIVGGAIAVVGLILLYAGKKKFDSFNPLPDETAEALKENVQWIMKPK